MNVEQKIKKEILILAASYDNIEEIDGIKLVELDDGNVIEELYENYSPDNIQDARNDYRCGEVETDISCDFSRHYESKSVAAKLSDGTWAGWTYWYGGGKHGEPYAIEWISEAYELNCKEEEKVVTIRTFEKK